MPRKLWIRFDDTEAYKSGAADLRKIIDEHGGRDKVVIYIRNPGLRKELPAGQGVRADEALAMGLVDRVVPADEVYEQAHAWAARLAAGQGWAAWSAA